MNKPWYQRVANKVFAPSASSKSAPISKGVAGSELYEWFTAGQGGAAGVAVNERSIRSISAAYACIELIGGSIGSLPLPFYRRSNSQRKRFTNDVWHMLNNRPWPNWSASTFWQYILSNKLLHGDGFAAIHRASPFSKTIIGFEPVHALASDVELKNGRLEYTLWLDGPNGVATVPKIFDQDDVLHFPGPGFDGRRGLSQIKSVLRRSAGIALAAEEHSARFFENGSRPDFAIEVPGNLDSEQEDLLRRTWAARHQGAARSGLPALMTGGAKLHELTMNAEDSQLIATRGMQIEDMARIFGVPPHMIGHTTNATSFGTGIEQMSIGFVKFTLQRHLVPIEQEINAKIFTGSDQKNDFCEWATAGLERGDTKTRNESYRIGLGRAGEPAWLTVNEVRQMENLPPISGGDEINSWAKEPAK